MGGITDCITDGSMKLVGGANRVGDAVGEGVTGMVDGVASGMTGVTCELKHAIVQSGESAECPTMF